MSFTKRAFPLRIILMSKKSPTIPKHVAIIPDGNRRWAKKKGLKPWEGHFKGIGDLAEEIAWTAFDMGVDYLSVWGGSYDNLTKRSKTEIKMLNKAYRMLINKALADKQVYERKVRIKFIGETQVLEKSTLALIKKAEETTKRHNKKHFNILVAYNGDREIISAVNKLLKSRKSATVQSFRSALWTGEVPPVDFVIRTGGEFRLSSFMPWDVGYAELYFSKKMWPEFTKADLKKAIKEYQSRERRFGK